MKWIVVMALLLFIPCHGFEEIGAELTKLIAEIDSVLQEPDEAPLRWEKESVRIRRRRSVPTVRTFRVQSKTRYPPSS